MGISLIVIIRFIVCMYALYANKPITDYRLPIHIIIVNHSIKRISPFDRQRIYVCKYSTLEISTNFVCLLLISNEINQAIVI